MKSKYKVTSIVQAKGIKSLKKSRLKKKGTDGKWPHEKIYTSLGTS